MGGDTLRGLQGAVRNTTPTAFGESRASAVISSEGRFAPAQPSQPLGAPSGGHAPPASLAQQVAQLQQQVARLTASAAPASGLPQARPLEAAGPAHAHRRGHALHAAPQGSGVSATLAAAVVLGARGPPTALRRRRLPRSRRALRRSPSTSRRRRRAARPRRRAPPPALPPPMEAPHTCPPPPGAPKADLSRCTAGPSAAWQSRDCPGGGGRCPAAWRFRRTGRSPPRIPRGR